MSIKILMPTLSPEMKTGKLVRWLVEEDQQVNPGDVIAEIETEKASIEIEAVDKGKVLRLLVPDGTEGVKVNTPIALLDGDRTGTKGESFQVRSKMVRLLEEIPSSRPAKSLGGDHPPPVGAVIGRTRLMGDHDQSALMVGPAPADRVGQLRTRLLIPSGGIGAEVEPVAGWLVVVKGPGRGGYRPVYGGLNSVGRDADQRISLSFGDDSISREEHAYVVYDEETRQFYLQRGKKGGHVRLGTKPVLGDPLLATGATMWSPASRRRLDAKTVEEASWAAWPSTHCGRSGHSED
jgi:pyruvate/2-oxoglutarate dehydrogenase complex dihydrolipoamide acyltransferase (E2) component